MGEQLSLSQFKLSLGAKYDITSLLYWLITKYTYSWKDTWHFFILCKIALATLLRGNNTKEKYKDIVSIELNLQNFLSDCICYCKNDSQRHEFISFIYTLNPFPAKQIEVLFICRESQNPFLPGYSHPITIFKLNDLFMSKILLPCWLDKPSFEVNVFYFKTAANIT